jgi:hypothetical protein
LSNLPNHPDYTDPEEDIYGNRALNQFIKIIEQTGHQYDINDIQYSEIFK